MSVGGLPYVLRATNLCRPQSEGSMGSLVKKRRKKMSKHKYRKRLRANRHKRKK